MTTDAQRAANRRNAQQSTGPRTTQGKAAVRSNAVRHGLLSRYIVVDTGDGLEIAEDYDALVDELRESLQARGRIELIQVEKIAFAYWRWRRGARFEAGAMRRRMRELDDKQRQQATVDECAVRRDLEALRRDRKDFDTDAKLSRARHPVRRNLRRSER